MSKSKKTKLEIKDSKNDIISNDVEFETQLSEIKVAPEPEEHNDESESPENESQLVFESKKAQKAHIKNIKESMKQESLIEKQKIEAERTRLEEVVAQIQNEIEKAKLKKAKVYEESKFQEAKLIAEAEKQKKIEAIELQKRSENLKSRQKDIRLIREQHIKKQTLIKEEIESQKVEVDQKLKLGKLQIREELKAKKREAILKKQEQKQLAFELAQKLKDERLRAYQEAEEEKARFKQELAQMKLELFAEKNRQREELLAKKEAARTQRIKEIEAVKEESLRLKDKRAKLFGELRASRLANRINGQKTESELGLELEQQKLEIEAVREKNEFGIEIIKRSNQIEVESAIALNDNLIQKKISIQPSEEDQQSKGMKAFKEDYVTLVSEFAGFEKRGQKALERAMKPISERTLNHFKNHVYYGPIVAEYIQLNEEGNFASLATMVAAAYVIAEDELAPELVDEKIKTLQKAILQGIPIRVGQYYVMPIKKSGLKSFYISHHLKDGEVVFDNNKLFSTAVIKAIDEIIDYKLEQGSSIRIIDGLAIANKDDGLAVVMYPNVIR